MRLSRVDVEALRDWISAAIEYPDEASFYANYYDTPEDIWSRDHIEESPFLMHCIEVWNWLHSAIDLLPVNEGAAFNAKLSKAMAEPWWRQAVEAMAATKRKRRRRRPGRARLGAPRGN